MSRVGFDLDGVVYDFRQAHSDFETGRGNAACALEFALDEWDYFLGWGMDLDAWLASYAAGVDAGEILWQGPPMPGATKAFEALRERGHTIHIVTDRAVGTNPEAATKAWLDEHNLVYDSLTFSRDKTIVETDFFIEDRIQNADAINAAGGRCYLINRPWNREEDDRLRVDSLGEFVAAVEAGR